MALILPRRKAGLDISQLFSVDLYTGNGSTQTITNGIDLSGEGGLVWLKDRSRAGYSHWFVDTERGVSKGLRSDNTNAELSIATVDQFNSDGFRVDETGGSGVNFSGDNQVAWTFRKSPSFFDVVTYTGDGTAGRTISHNLGVTPGMVVTKRTDSLGDWYVTHRSIGSNELKLNDTGAASEFVIGYSADDTNINLGSGTTLNTNTATYVAYCFAHDTTDNGVIQCGSYTGNGSSTGPTVTLGWEPQWVMIKRATGGTGSWYIWDSARDGTNPRSAFLYPNQSAAEGTGVDMDFTSTGFQIKDSGTEVNPSGSTVIYVAIRAEGV